jgi:hypothetical protein
MSTPTVRAKFVCYEKVQQENDRYVVRLRAVYGDGQANKSWAKYTPSGQLEMVIDNPDASERFEVGKEYFLDFTPAGE